MRAAALAVALAACSIPDEKSLVTADAQGDPFACLGQPPPTTAPAEVTLAGMAVDPTSDTPVSDAMVQGFIPVDTSLFTVSTDATGTFTRLQPTGSVPLDMFFQITLSGFLTGLFYPSAPIAHDLNEQIQMFTTNDLATIGAASQVDIDSTKAQLLVIVEDCNGAPVGGATITATGDGQILYFDMGRPKAGLLVTDGATGAALIVNLTPTAVTVGATVGNMTLRSHAVSPMGSAVLETEVQP